MDEVIPQRDARARGALDEHPLLRARRALDEHPLLRVGLLALLLVGMTLAAYAPALEAGFVWDDDDYVTANPLLAAPDGLWRIWFTMDAPSQYVPMVYSALRLQYAFFGLEPFGYHLVNVLLQAVNALLIWGLLSQLRLPGAWFAAAIFAVHPVHVESVAWVTELKNLLSLLFSVLSLSVWIRFLESGKPTVSKLYGLSLLLYLPALLSKATACTLPGALLLLLWLRGEQIDRRRIAQVAGFALLGVAMGLVTMYWETVHVGTQGERFSLSPLEALWVASRAPWFYLEKLVWPVGLTFSYPKFEIDPSDPLAYGWLLAGLALLWALWASRERIGRGPLVAMLFFVGTLSPLLGFIPLYTFWYTYVADHYQYVASLGPIALFAGVSVPWARRHLGPNPSAALALLVLGLLGAQSFEQSRIYESRETLWRDTLAKHPSSWMAHANLGRYLLTEQRYLEALDAYRGALEIRPETYRAHLGMARAQMELGKEASVLVHLRAALEIEPDAYQGRQMLAQLYARRGDAKQALAECREMIRIRPRHAHPHYLLGGVLLQLGRHEEARTHFLRALELDPGHSGARRALERAGRNYPRGE
ncbi:MAG: tetratricopeptide repeat protein [bacterium]|nr:tetratricopeptide repeat protein [bacterium]